MDEPSKLLCIICPVYQEENVVGLFYQRISQVLLNLPKRYDYNLVFVDNCSQDKTRDAIRGIIRQNPRVFLVTMSRNFGYQRSVECGLRMCKGDLYQVIDVDCEDPPEMILDFLSEYEKGCDVVYGLRSKREELWVIAAMRKLFYRVTRSLADENFILDMAEYALISRDVRDAIIQENNSFPFIRASVGRIGFPTKGIPYKRNRRIAGRTKYSLFGMTVFAISGILSTTTIFLRLPAYVFPVWSLSVIALAAFSVFSDARWIVPALLAIGFLYCGFTVTFIAIYVARVYKNTLMRPNFVINRKESILQN